MREKLPKQVQPKKECEKSKKSNKKTIAIAVAVLFLVGAFVTANGFNLYKNTSNEGFSSTVAKFIPYPAATVGASIISIDEYKDNLETVDFFYQGQVGQSEEYEYDEKEVKQETLNILIENKIISALAKKYDVSLSEDELSAEYQDLIEQVGGEDMFAERIKTIYNISPEEFVEKSLRPNLLLSKLQEKYNTDDSIDSERKQPNQEAKQKAEDILQQIKDGTDFAQLAKENSDDKYSGENGGELGFFGKGQMVPAFEEAAFSLEKGEVSDVVRTQYGYHIIKVEDKKVDETAQDQVSARHILISTEDFFGQWLQEQKKSAAVRIFIDGFSWSEGKVKTD